MHLERQHGHVYLHEIAHLPGQRLRSGMKTAQVYRWNFIRLSSFISWNVKSNLRTNTRKEIPHFIFYFYFSLTFFYFYLYLMFFIIYCFSPILSHLLAFIPASSVRIGKFHLTQVRSHHSTCEISPEWGETLSIKTDDEKYFVRRHVLISQLEGWKLGWFCLKRPLRRRRFSSSSTIIILIHASTRPNYCHIYLSRVFSSSTRPQIQCRTGPKSYSQSEPGTDVAASPADANRALVNA